MTGMSSLAVHKSQARRVLDSGLEVSHVSKKLSTFNASARELARRLDALGAEASSLQQPVHCDMFLPDDMHHLAGLVDFKHVTALVLDLDIAMRKLHSRLSLMSLQKRILISPSAAQLELVEFMSQQATEESSDVSICSYMALDDGVAMGVATPETPRASVAVEMAFHHCSPARVSTPAMVLATENYTPVAKRAAAEHDNSLITFEEMLMTAATSLEDISSRESSGSDDSMPAVASAWSELAMSATASDSAASQAGRPRAGTALSRISAASTTDEVCVQASQNGKIKDAVHVTPTFRSRSATRAPMGASAPPSPGDCTRPASGLVGRGSLSVPALKQEPRAGCQAVVQSLNKLAKALGHPEVRALTSSAAAQPENKVSSLTAPVGKPRWDVDALGAKLLSKNTPRSIAAAKLLSMTMAKSTKTDSSASSLMSAVSKLAGSAKTPKLALTAVPSEAAGGKPSSLAHAESEKKTAKVLKARSASVLPIPRASSGCSIMGLSSMGGSLQLRPSSPQKATLARQMSSPQQARVLDQSTPTTVRSGQSPTQVARLVSPRTAGHGQHSSSLQVIPGLRPPPSPKKAHARRSPMPVRSPCADDSSRSLWHSVSHGASIAIRATGK